MQEHKHVAHVLEEAKKAALSGDVVALRNLSDQTIHATAIHQDTDNVLVAVLVYALSKLIERKASYSGRDFSKYLNYYFKTIDYSINCVHKDKCDLFRNRIGEIMDVPGLESSLKKTVQDVFEKARINKASRVYEHGISMGTTAKLLGISLWDLSGYVGQSSISEMEEANTISVKLRVKKAMEFFE